MAAAAILKPVKPQ